MAGWWWDTASAAKRFRFAFFMLAVAAFLVVYGAVTASIAPLLIGLGSGAFMVVQLRRASANRRGS